MSSPLSCWPPIGTFACTPPPSPILYFSWSLQHECCNYTLVRHDAIKRSCLIRPAWSREMSAATYTNKTMNTRNGSAMAAAMGTELTITAANSSTQTVTLNRSRSLGCTHILIYIHTSRCLTYAQSEIKLHKPQKPVHSYTKSSRAHTAAILDRQREFIIMSCCFLLKFLSKKITFLSSNVPHEIIGKFTKKSVGRILF